MTDTALLRLSIIGVIVLVLLVFWVFMRRPRPIKVLEASALGLGVHLFTSARCRGCDELRRSLDQALGSGSYTEHAEDEEAVLFSSAGIDQIPVVVTVTGDERPRVWKDMPPRRVLERALHRQ